MNEAHREYPSESPESITTASPSEAGGHGNVAATATGPASGRASGRESGALAGNQARTLSPPRPGPSVRAPRPDELPICVIGDCHNPTHSVVVIPGQAGEMRPRLCLVHAQDLLMELAERIGVGRHMFAIERGGES